MTNGEQIYDRAKTDGIVNTLCYLLKHLSRRGHTSLLLAPDGGPLSYAATPVIPHSAVRFPLYPQLRLAAPSLSSMQRLEAALGLRRRSL